MPLIGEPCASRKNLGAILLLLVFSVISASPSQSQEAKTDTASLLERLQALEARLRQVEASATSSTDGTADEEAQAKADEAAATERQTLLQRLDAVEEQLRDEGAGSQQAEGEGDVDLQEVLARLDELERRLSELETTAVLSEPETRVRRVEKWVDENGIEHDEPVEGAERVVTYERERVYRRQTIGEKIEEAIAAESESKVAIGVDAAIMFQFTDRSNGADQALPGGNAYELASADLFFTARIAHNTVVFADVVGLSGSPPDKEVPTLSLINGYTARLGIQNELNLREAWLRTELFKQTLAISGGRLDLTNYFDRNAVANDETSQFLSDVLVNNPALGLSSNGAGVAAVYDAKHGFNFKIGFQQSDPNATNLSDSISSLAEVGFVATPFRAGEGNYRFWFRTDNSSGEQATAYGASLDQKVSQAATLFARYGAAEAGTGDDHFYSIGLGFQNKLVFNRWDSWGLGYALSDFDVGDQERVAEAYYNLGLSERLRLSTHLQYFDVENANAESFAYLALGVRLQASF